MPSTSCLRLAGSCLALLGVVGLCPAARAQPSTVEPTPPPDEPGAASRRFGVDGGVSLGIAAAAYASLRYEHKVTRWGVVTFRGGGLRAQVLQDESNGMDGAFIHVGWRQYYGNGYFGVEIGPGLFRKRAYESFDEMIPERKNILPSGQITFGGKLSVVDVGLSIVAPLLGVGVHLGIDLGVAGG